tara:strand:+ start:46 stop:261 length:216 start_codon:yes stop_codon:yes gene_type:complete
MVQIQLTLQLQSAVKLNQVLRHQQAVAEVEIEIHKMQDEMVVLVAEVLVQFLLVYLVVQQLQVKEIMVVMV